MLLRTAPCTSSRSPSFIHNSGSVRETRGAVLSQGWPQKDIREKWWNQLESSRSRSRTRTSACRQYMACRTRRIMHSHVRRMSTQWDTGGRVRARQGLLSCGIWGGRDQTGKWGKTVAPSDTFLRACAFRGRHLRPMAPSPHGVRGCMSLTVLLTHTTKYVQQ